MADGFSITVDSKALLAMMDRVGPSLDFHCRDVARVTANKIARKAAARVAYRTGTTHTGIHAERTLDEKGYVVLGYDVHKGDIEKKTAYFRGRHRQAHVDIYLEYGTKFMMKQPFFFDAAFLEMATYNSLIRERIQQVLTDLGR